jgi:hypothetical protein
MSHSAPVTHNKDFLGCQGLNWRMHNITDLEDLAAPFRQDGALVYFSPNDDKHAALWDAQREELRRLEFAPELIPVELLADNQVLDCLRDKCFALSSDELSDPTLRTIVLSPGGQPGQRIILSWAGPGVGQLLDGSTVDGTAFVVRLSGDWTPAVGDSIALLDTGGDYFEIGRGGPSGWPGEAADFNWTGQHTWSKGLFLGVDAQAWWGSALTSNEAFVGYTDGGSGVYGALYANRGANPYLELDCGDGTSESFLVLANQAGGGVINFSRSVEGTPSFEIRQAAFGYETTIDALYFGGHQTTPDDGAGGGMYITSKGDKVFGGGNLAADAINGFVFMPGSGGTPTGVPELDGGLGHPVVYDQLAEVWYFYNWIEAEWQPMFDLHLLDGPVGIDTTPDASAVLDCGAGTLGFLPPRMNKSNRDAIASPADGLMIYQTDATPGLRVRENGAWVKYTATADP